MSPTEITINNQKFTHIKSRLNSPVSIYGNPDFFLRIGEEKCIKRELELHKKILERGFPVAKLIDEGFLNDEYYYIEESLGETLLGRLFSQDYKTNCEISSSNFWNFMDIVTRYATSQASTIGKSLVSAPNFWEGTHIDFLFDELPYLQEITTNAFYKAQKRLSIFPTVFSQGDFNPHNLFPKGVIDFDMGFMAPFGYDLVTAILHTYAFPTEGIAEYTRGYLFSQAQEKYYFETINSISESKGLPKLSDYIQDFLIGRIIWSVVRMHDTPKLQKWRYDKFQHIIETYLDDRDYMEMYKI